MGALTMDLIDLEIKRTEHRAAEEGIVPAVVAQKALDAASGKVTLQERCVLCVCTSVYVVCVPVCVGVCVEDVSVVSSWLSAIVCKSQAKIAHSILR